MSQEAIVQELRVAVQERDAARARAAAMRDVLERIRGHCCCLHVADYGTGECPHLVVEIALACDVGREQTDLHTVYGYEAGYADAKAEYERRLQARQECSSSLLLKDIENLAVWVEKELHIPDLNRRLQAIIEQAKEEQA